MNATDKLLDARRTAFWREVALTRYHGHRRDQIRYSATVLLCLAGLAGLGFMLGALAALLGF